MIKDILFVLLGIVIGNVITRKRQQFRIRSLTKSYFRAKDNYDMVFESRAEAEKIASQMVVLLTDYKLVTVGDLLDLTGNSSSFDKNTIGWTNLSDMKILRTRSGYTLMMPKTINLK